MTSINNGCNRFHRFNKIQPYSPLLLACLLSACGGSGTDSAAGSPATVGASSGSSSGDLLASQNESTVTVASLIEQELENGSSSFSPTDSLAAANPDAPTMFFSQRTSGFSGEVLGGTPDTVSDFTGVALDDADDAIRISWEAFPGARGYNISRQGQFLTTVIGDTEYLDTDVFDGSYYYTIQAFDSSEPPVFTDIAEGLTVIASTFGTTDPNAPATNEGLLDDYEMVFSDEFNGNQLDATKWNTAFLWGPDVIINQEEQYYVDINNEPDFGYNPFSFDGDSLIITTIETPDALVADANDQAYLSGMITSYDAFKFTYGYAETRAKLPYGRGYWPAFWLLNAYYGAGEPADPEIDIMEYIGHELDAVHHTYHYFETPSSLRSQSTFTSGIDFTSDFHTFSVEWEPNLLVFYVDGIERYRIVDANVSSEEMYVLANTAIGGWWAGAPDETTLFPNTYEIDYIRVYQKVTPFNDIQLDQTDHVIPLFDQTLDSATPLHRPTLEGWPADQRP